MQIANYVKAGYSILYLLTPEENRAEREIVAVAQACKRSIKVWSHTEGFFTPGPKGPEDQEQIEDPIEALNKIKNDPVKNVIYIFRDLHRFFGGNSQKVVRLLRDIARDFKQKRLTLVLISPVSMIPPELERDMVLIEFDLPTPKAIGEVFDVMYSANGKPLGEVTADERERIIQSAMGLSVIEAENAMSKAVIESYAVKDVEKRPTVSSIVMKEKALTVKKTGILEYFDTDTSLKDVGGLENLKKWFNIRKLAFSKRAREFGLPMPRGCLLAGLPGCGKSLSAKAAANVLGVPLIRLDIGRVFQGLVGASEQNMRNAIQTIEAIGNSVVWVDEMDKAFAGMMGGGSGDNGTSQRVFGTFITWMQEKKSPSFIMATINRIEGLPPELLRKGRFDEIFFVNLPTAKEREEILKIQILKERRPVEYRTGPWPHTPDKMDLSECVESSAGFSGAEIEEAVISGLYTTFDRNTPLKSDYILSAILNTTPLSKSAKKNLEAMAEWAKTNAVNASLVEKEGDTGRKLTL